MLKMNSSNYNDHAEEELLDQPSKRKIQCRLAFLSEHKKNPGETGSGCVFDRGRKRINI